MTEQETKIVPLPILTAPHPVLKQKARPVTPEDMPSIKQVLPRMFAAMYAAPGIGLAAPQVGISQRFFIIDLMEEERNNPRIFINPEITFFSTEENTYKEGCLSLPDQFEEVIRPSSIKVRFKNENFDDQEIEADGLLATCIQHELDHLNGVLFVDHLSRLKKEMILKRLTKRKKTAPTV